MQSGLCSLDPHGGRHAYRNPKAVCIAGWYKTMDYAYIILLYYICILVLLAPWFLLLRGAIRLLRRNGGRLRRLQVEGAALLSAGSVAKWIVFDPNFGFDRLRVEIWSYWFSRGEIGLFLIGLLLFGLGFFLEREPRPALRPWPRIGKIISMTAILSGIALGTVAYIVFGYPWFELPWSAARILFSLGVLPFAIGYVLFGKHSPDPPPGF